MALADARARARTEDSQSLTVSNVQLWHVDLDASAALHANSWLDHEESQRAILRRSPADRRRFIAAHTALRSILSNLLGIAPEEVTFESNAHRKPHLAPRLNADRWQFNMTRSAHRAIIAVTQRRRIGADIELVTQTYDDLRPVTDSFTEHERRQLDALPREEAALAFYRCWTRKEAFLKAIGVGLLGQMNAFSVNVDPGNARLLHVDATLGSIEDWTLVALDSSESDYAAAIAIEGSDGATISNRVYVHDAARWS